MEMKSVAVMLYLRKHLFHILDVQGSMRLLTLTLRFTLDVTTQVFWLQSLV